MEKYILLLIIIFIGALGQVFLKLGVSRALLPEIHSFGDILQSVFILSKNHWIWLVFLMYGPGLFIYLYLLRKYELSYLLPLLSLVYILVLLFSWIFLKENITVLRIVGTLLITFGAFLIAKSF